MRKVAIDGYENVDLASLHASGTHPREQVNSGQVYADVQAFPGQPA